MSETDHCILVFDGVCVLCSHWVTFLLRHDKKQQFYFAAMQTPMGKTLLTKSGIDPNDPVSLLLKDGDLSYTQSDAVIRILSRLGGFWQLITIIKFVPRPMRDICYRGLARNRYRWFGKREQCLMPSAETQKRFLT